MNRVSVLVDGEREEQLARTYLAKNTADGTLNRYDGLLTGWATDEDVAEMQRDGLQVEATPMQDAPTGIDQLAARLAQADELPFCLKLRGPMRPQWRKMRSRKIQITLASLEETIADQSPLDFSILKAWDALGSLESTRQARWLRSEQDVQI